MRLILVLVLLLAAFALAAWLAPTQLYLPLYCLFLAAGLGYVLWERRRIQARRQLLEEDYRAHRAEWETTGWAAGEEE